MIPKQILKYPHLDPIYTKFTCILFIAFKIRN